MSSTPGPNMPVSATLPEAPVDFDKVADENKALASALRKSRLDNQALTSQLKDVHIHRKNDGEAGSSISSKSSSKSSTSEARKGKVRQSGQKYMVMYRPWEPTLYTGSIEEAEFTDPYDVLRYTNPRLREQCEYMELYNVIPKTPEHLDMLKGRLPKYIKAFQSGLNSGRTNLVSQLKLAGGNIYMAFNREYPNFFIARGEPGKQAEHCYIHASYPGLSHLVTSHLASHITSRPIPSISGYFRAIILAHSNTIPSPALNPHFRGSVSHTKSIPGTSTISASASATTSILHSDLF
ncbi:hypothetical protein PM082_015658 [Marasmius tenuissimus]|nr:hypothetical protein PM082_015658 [Marasmius tenuissimus]